MGAVVDVGADARVAAANAQADTYYQCPFAKNLVAASIKKVIDAYRPLNPNLKYVVLVGNDQVIPFVRHPDQAQLANESGYVPPVLNATSSQASLRMGFFLSQDDYGAQTTLNLLAASIPLPDLAVGRLVETASDVNAYLDAYLGTTNGVVNPTTALVTGYDFLSDAADAVKNELTAGLAAPIDTLIADRSWSPADSRSWTADKLRAQLLTNRHDLIYLAGHFSAGSTLAADYTTRVMASEVASSTVDLRNAVVFSSGCHSGYSVVNDHAVPNVTPNPDWAQTFNRKGAALIAGSGYQYGDSDFVEYGERLYLEFAQQLRAQAGPVAIGPALYRAKQQYLEDTGSETTGIYQKQLLIATLFGLPMLSVDLPGAPVVPPTTTSIVTTLTPYTTAPGSILNLNATNVSVDLNRTVSLASKVLTNTAAPNQTITASYLVGPDGVALKPNEPVLPRAVYDVTVPGTVLRGVGFLGGSYADHANIVPLVSTPATELGAVRSLFRTNYFYPVRLWNTNYFAVLKDPLNGTTRLTLTPAQYLSQTADANNGTLRQYKDLQLRLFYSNNTQRYGNNVPALAAAPAIQSIELVTDGGQVVICARVTGDPAAGIQEVWTTYTALSGPRYGQWQSLKLIQNSVDSTLWEGTLPLNGDDASNLRFMFQAVNGVGLVTMLTNQGSYYIPNQVAAPGSGIVPPPPATLAFANPPTTGAYGTMVTVKAILRNGGTPLANQAVVFALGGQTQTAQTNTLGEASATLKVLNTVGNYALRANFIGDATYGGATTSVSFNVVPQATTLTLDPVSATIDLTVDSGMVATLKDSLGNPIRDKTVVVIVSNATDNTTIVGITDYLGRVRVGTITLPEGAYTVAAYFSGEIPFPTGAQLLSDDRYAPAIAQGTLVVDVTAPTTTATLSGTPALDCGTNCFQGNVILTFTTSEAATTQYRVQSPGGSFGAWRTYSGPVTLSDAGTSTVEFFSTDLVRHVEGTQQVLVQIQHTVIEPALTAVLDTFNRSNGALKLNWYGEGLGGYAIRRTAVEVFGGGAIYWNPRADFGVNQEAYFTFTTVHSSAREQDLLLKVQGGTRPDWRKGAIEVLYDVVHGAVRVETFRPGLSAWTIYPNIPAVYLPGDQIRGRALSNGTVRIYRNNELIGTVTLNPNDQAFFNSKSGRIGTWFIGGSGARFDNFGGGTLP